MRGSSRAVEIVSSFLELGIETPSWSAGRLWLLRIGLYKLERPKTIADDWIWIIDHTVQLGHEKCMVIVGIRQSTLPKGELFLAHEDVEPIAIIPVEKSNGEVVFEQLEQSVEKTGIPKQIVSDNGTDIKAGVERFCEKYDTVRTYDIKHKAATIVKRELKGEARWEQFSKLAGKTNKKVQQTKLSGMAPPNQRSKARYMNVDELIDWATDMLVRLDVEKRQLGEKFETCELYEKFGWLFEYRYELRDWKSLVDTVKTANSFVNFMGLYRGVDEDLRQILDDLPQNRRFSNIKEELILFAAEQQQKIGVEDRLLASSEIIESVIGKYKKMQHDQVKGGFTGMLLGLSAALSDLSMDTVKIAIDSTPTKKVWRWIKENLGKSVHAKRKEFHKIAREEEQKSAKNLCPNFR
jgi:hypothetical protein